MRHLNIFIYDYLSYKYPGIQITGIGQYYMKQYKILWIDIKESEKSKCILSYFIIKLKSLSDYPLLSGQILV